MTAPPCIWFCATGKTGLGHLRRVSTIARAVARHAGGAISGLVTNSTLDGLEASDRAAFAEIAMAERDAMGPVVAGGRAIVVDTAVVPGIEALAVPLALILRETVAERQGRFRLPGGRLWDLVIVPNPADHWLPEPGLARRVEAVGWIYRRVERAPVERRGLPEVLVATGGGGSNDIAARLRDEIDGVLAAARDRASFRVAQSAGARLPEVGRLAGADGHVDPGGELHRHFAAADVVISTAGYNSVLELAGLDVPALIVPIERTIDDQVARARLWGPRLGAWHRERTESAGWLAEAVTARRRRQPWDLGPSGEARAAELILGLAG